MDPASGLRCAEPRQGNTSVPSVVLPAPAGSPLSVVTTRSHMDPGRPPSQFERSGIKCRRRWGCASGHAASRSSESAG
jgi:hypothetical protein